MGGRGKQKTENTKGPPGPGGERVWAGGKQKTKNSAGPCKRPWSNEDVICQPRVEVARSNTPCLDIFGVEPEIDFKVMQPGGLQNGKPRHHIS